MISLGSYSTELPVEPGPLSLVLRRAPDGEVVFPGADETPRKADAVKGGEQVYAELSGQTGSSLKDLDAQLHLTNATPPQQPFVRIPDGSSPARSSFPKATSAWRARRRFASKTAASSAN